MCQHFLRNGCGRAGQLFRLAVVVRTVSQWGFFCFFLIQVCARPRNLAFLSEEIPLAFVRRQGSTESVWDWEM